MVNPLSSQPPQEAILGLGSKVVNKVCPLLYPCDGGREQSLEGGCSSLEERRLRVPHRSLPHPPDMNTTVSSLFPFTTGPENVRLAQKEGKKFVVCCFKVNKKVKNLWVVSLPM